MARINPGWPTSNPLRGHYLLVGTDLVRAGIQVINGKIGFYRESSNTPIDVIDPATERWVTSRAVASAAAKTGLVLDMSALEASLVVPFMKSDPRAVIRLTEDAIVAIAGGETPEIRAYAQDQVKQLQAAYNGAATAAA